MTATEDAVRSTIQAHTDAAELPLDGHAMLTRIRSTQHRRRRARRAGSAAAALAAACTAGIGGWTVARTNGPTTTLPPATAPEAAAGSTVAVGNLALRVPAGWLVNSRGSGVMSYPAEAMAPGPYVSTVPTGDMCRTVSNGMECSRTNGIIAVPTQGVIAWLAFGTTAFPGYSDDQGPATGTTCTTPTSVPFHAFRRLGSGQESMRVALDGCIYGPHTKRWTAELIAIIDSIHLTTPTPSPSP